MSEGMENRSLREIMKEDFGATDQQLESKIFLMTEQAISLMAEDEVEMLSAKGIAKLMMQLHADEEEIGKAKRSLESVIYESIRSINELRRSIEEARKLTETPTFKLLEKNSELFNMNDTKMTETLSIYSGMLEATKMVFGEKLTDDVMCKAIEAASYGTWRHIMGEK